MILLCVHAHLKVLIQGAVCRYQSEMAAVSNCSLHHWL